MTLFAICVGTIGFIDVTGYLTTKVMVLPVMYMDHSLFRAYRDLDFLRANHIVFGRDETTLFGDAVKLIIVDSVLDDGRSGCGGYI